MKQILENKNKVIIALSLIIIIAGIIVTVTKGFNFDLNYQDTNKIELNIGKEFNNEDIKIIAKEQLNTQKVMIQKVEEFEDAVAITAKQINEEQRNNIVTKINEKYETQIDSSNIEIQYVKHVRGRDIIKPYIVPFIIATAMILGYMAMKHHKLGEIKVITKSVVILVLIQVILFSVMAITRIPVGRLTIPLVLVVYLITLILLTEIFEKELKNKQVEDKKSK